MFGKKKLIQTIIPVIETTKDYSSQGDSRTRFILFIEDPTKSLQLTRYYSDLQEFHDQIIKICPNCKIRLPKLNQEKYYFTQENNNGRQSQSKKILRKLFDFFSKKKEFNSAKIEKYLSRCWDDPTDKFRSLLNEFLEPRHEDKIVLKLPTEQDFNCSQLIEKGSSGEVYLVQHKTTLRQFALKVIRKKAVIDQKQKAHIKAEQQILSKIASIQHPFLIKLHYSFEGTVGLYLVLDFHARGDLATQLARYGKLPSDLCRLYIAEILMGLQELHRLDIVYRDLKPENILVGADGHVVLTDFGLSKQFDNNFTLTKTFCGTPEYMAPEIIRQELYSCAVDYWSLGILLFEMITGNTPFHAENDFVVYKRICEDNLTISEDFDIVTAYFIANLLRRDPVQRLKFGQNACYDLYFHLIIWDDIHNKRIKPPYVPPIQLKTDSCLFETLEPNPLLVQSNDTNSSSIDEVFKDYSYVNIETLSSYSPPSVIYCLKEPPSITFRDRRLVQNGIMGSDDVEQVYTISLDGYVDTRCEKSDSIQEIDRSSYNSDSYSESDSIELIDQSSCNSGIYDESFMRFNFTQTNNDRSRHGSNCEQQSDSNSATS